MDGLKDIKRGRKLDKRDFLKEFRRKYPYFELLCPVFKGKTSTDRRSNYR